MVEFLLVIPRKGGDFVALIPGYRQKKEPYFSDNI
jgi:hypothetical protein